MRLFCRQQVTTTFPKIEGGLRIGIQIEERHPFTDRIVNTVIEGDVTDMLYPQGQVFFDDLADQGADVLAVLLPLLIERQLEMKAPQLLLQEGTLLGIELPHDVQEEIRIAHGGPRISPFRLISQGLEII